MTHMKPHHHNKKGIATTAQRLLLPFTLIGCIVGVTSPTLAEDVQTPFGLTAEQAKQAARHPHAAKKAIRAKQEHPELTPERARKLGHHRKAARGLHRMHEANPQAARKEARKLNRAHEAHPGLNAKQIRKAKNNPIAAKRAHKAHARHGLNKKQMRKARNHRR